MVQEATEQNREKEETLLVDSLRTSRGAYMVTGQYIALEDGLEVTVTDWGVATTRFDED